MRTTFEILGDKIREGYVIRPEHYSDENVTIYQVVKHDSETSRTVYCEIARNVAYKLKKEYGATIEQPIECAALNFIPLAVKPNCVRYTEY